MKKIPSAVATKLKHYVYLYLDPLTDEVFYVGKGKGQRALSHLEEALNAQVAATIREIRDRGDEPRIEILVHGLPDGDTALRVEAAAIDLLGVKNLDNGVRGSGGRKFGRTPLDELVAHYSHRPVDIKEPAILIRINRLYRYGMSEVELYDATRSAWKVGPRKDGAKLAVAVYQGVVREVYTITAWLPGGSTLNTRYGAGGRERSDRWEFVGVVADAKVRERYVNGYVGHLFSQGAQNPISYANLDS